MTLPTNTGQRFPPIGMNNSLASMMAQSHVWMPLTTIIDGDPVIVWNEETLGLIPTLIPRAPSP